MDYSGNVDIKVWAEINGFIEVYDGVGDKNLLTPSENLIFHLQKLNVLNTDYGFCSVFYTERSYIVSYHFYAADKHKILERRDTVISIVIRRGYRIVHPFAVLSQLRKKYEGILSNQSTIKELGFNVLQVLDSWKHDILENIEKDDMQPLINLPGKVINKGYVVCQNMLEIKTYLDYPLRVDFRGFKMMLFLLKNVADNTDFTPLLSNFLHIKVKLIYSRTFAVYFPAYQDAPIANIASLDEELDFQFEKQNCCPIHLQGKYSEHMSDWKILPTDEKTGYIIGLQFEEKEYRYRIDVKFIDLKGGEQKAQSVNTWLSPSSGKILCEDNDYWLVLKGSENEQLSHLEFRSDRDNYRVGKWTLSGNVINITIDEVFLFKVAELKKYIYDKYKFTPEIFLSVKKRWLACNDDRVSLKGAPQDYRIRISGSPDYQEAEFSMGDANLTGIRLIRKPDLSFNFRFKGAIQEWLEASDRRYLILSEVRSDSDIPLEFKLNLSRNMLKMPVSSITKKYCLKAPGFKDKCIVLNEKNTDIEVEMRLIWWRKIQRLCGMALFVGLSFGLFLGYIAGCLWYPMFSDKVIVTEDELEEGGIEELKPVESDASTYSTPVSYYNDSLQNEGDFSTVDDKSSEPSTPVVTSAPVAVEKQMSPKLTKLMEKLKGIEYTNGDIAKAKEQARKEGSLKKNFKFFEEVQFALNVVAIPNVRIASYVKRKLGKCTELSSEQKSAIEKIVEDELVYNSDARSFNTIKEMYEIYK